MVRLYFRDFVKMELICEAYGEEISIAKCFVKDIKYTVWRKILVAENFDE